MCRSLAEVEGTNRKCRRCETTDATRKLAAQNRKKGRLQRRALREQVALWYGKEASAKMRNLPPSQIPYVLASLGESNPDFVESCEAGIIHTKALVSEPGRGKGMTADDVQYVVTELKLNDSTLVGMHHGNLLHAREDTEWDHDEAGNRKRLYDHRVAQMALYTIDRQRLEETDPDKLKLYFGGDPATDEDAAAARNALAERVELQRAGVASGAYGLESGATNKDDLAQAQRMYHEYLSHASDEEIEALCAYSDDVERHMRDVVFDAAVAEVSPREVLISRDDELDFPAEFVAAREKEGVDMTRGVEVAEGVYLQRVGDVGVQYKVAIGAENGQEKYIEFRPNPMQRVGQTLNNIPKVDDIGMADDARVNPAYRGVVERDLGTGTDSETDRGRGFRDDIREHVILAAMHSNVPAGMKTHRRVSEGRAVVEKHTGKAQLGLGGASELGMKSINGFESRKYGSEADLAERMSRAAWARENEHYRRLGIRRDQSPKGADFKMTKKMARQHQAEWEAPQVTPPAPDMDRFKSMGLDETAFVRSSYDAEAADTLLADDSIDNIVAAANNTVDPSPSRRRRYVPGASREEISARRLLDTAAVEHYAERSDAARGSRGYVPVTTKVRGNADDMLRVNGDGTVSMSRYYAGSSQGTGAGPTTVVVTGTSLMHNGSDRAIVNPTSRYVVSHEATDDDGNAVIYLTEAGDVVDDLQDN